MTEDFTLANAVILLPDEAVRGSLRVENGRIAAIDSGTAVPGDAINCEGDYIAPGLIELHTDNLERHISPRPKVDWPHQAAIIAHDGEMASVGVTTVFDAIRVGSIVSGPVRRYPRYARALADEILATRDTGALKISHHLHLRAEMCSETLVDELDEFGPRDRVGIVSIMDHTPGQRQFTDESKFEMYVRGKYDIPKEKFAGYMAFLRGLQSEYGARHEAAAVGAARRFGATLASHDDTTVAQVENSRGHGVKVAEFPTTLDACKASHAAGISVVMGGPNLVRGGSHSGNVAALTAAENDVLDILSSDYVPASLLMGAVQLGVHWGDMARGIGTVTHAPARAVHLEDRGRLEPGLRADLIQFRTLGEVPALRGVWHDGHRIG